MNKQQLKRMHTGKGFIAALDQSGGSTPKALKLYGIHEDAYHGEEEMFSLIHEMRTRIIKSPPLPPSTSWEPFSLSRPWIGRSAAGSPPITSGRSKGSFPF